MSMLRVSQVARELVVRLTGFVKLKGKERKDTEGAARPQRVVGVHPGGHRET